MLISILALFAAVFDGVVNQILEQLHQLVMIAGHLWNHGLRPSPSPVMSSCAASGLSAAAAWRDHALSPMRPPVLTCSFISMRLSDKDRRSAGACAAASTPMMSEKLVAGRPASSLAWPRKVSMKPDYRRQRACAIQWLALAMKSAPQLLRCAFTTGEISAAAARSPRARH
jgi:hypothetical protein